MSVPSVIVALQLSLALLPSFGGANVDPFSVRLVASDRYGFEADYLAMVGEQVGRILLEAGVEVSWAGTEASPVVARRPPGAAIVDAGSAAAPEIEVIFAARSPESWGAKRYAMGTVIPTAHPRRRVVVFPGRVLRVLDFDRPGLPPSAVYTEAAALAFARVIVHEVVHALVPDHSHADDGLMRGSLSRKFLLSSTLPLDAVCLGAIDELIRRADAGNGDEPPG